MYVTSVVPFEKIAPGLCVLVNATAPQLSVAVGAVQLTGIVHPDGRETAIFAGQPEITGGVASISAGWQHMAPALLLAPAITVKSPKTDPTKTPPPQFVLMEAFSNPRILKFKKFDANLSSARDPVTVKVPPDGTTNVPISPFPSSAVTTAGSRNPLYLNVKLIRPPEQGAQLAIGGQLQPWL